MQCGKEKFLRDQSKGKDDTDLAAKKIAVALLWKVFFCFCVL